MTEYI